MHIEVNKQGQLNVEIDNLIATKDSELDALRSGLAREYPRLTDLVIKLDRTWKQGQHYNVRFVVPGPALFTDQRLSDLLHGIGFVRWDMETQVRPLGQPPDF